MRLHRTGSGRREPTPAPPPAVAPRPTAPAIPGRLTPEEATAASVAGGWSDKSRYRRRAEVEEVTRLTPTGTVRIRFRVADDLPFEHEPGNFVGVEYAVEGVGYARSPYCLLSAPSDHRGFELLVRVVADGPVSRYLGSCVPGETVVFRGPTGRSMRRRDAERDVVLVGTGVGVAPLLALAHDLLDRGFDRRIDLFWGLRLEEDLCLVDELDDLARRHPTFSWRVSLSRPGPAWRGLRGRVTESVPPLLETLGGRQYFLVGNGAMTEELGTALSDLGAAREFLYTEPYFNQRHVPDPATMAAIRSRFVAADLFSPIAHQQSRADLFHLEAPLGGSGNADPGAPSDAVRRMPSGTGRSRNEG